MPFSRREDAFGRAYRVVIAFYYVFCAAMTIVYAAKADVYHALISAGTLIVPPALYMLHRLLKLRRSAQLDMLTLGFITLAYPLGGCIDLYRIIPGFDKLAHGLSGTYVAMLCIILFIQLKPGHKLSRADIPLAFAFVFFGSTAVAGLWEVGEYLVSGIVKMDLQRVHATGVADSMNDMLICLAGTLLALPAIPRLIRGKDGLLISPVRAFCERNAKGLCPLETRLRDSVP